MVLTFHPISNVMRVEVPENSTGMTSISKLPDGFDWKAPHLLRIEADFRRLKISMDDVAMPKLKTLLAAPLDSFSVSSENQSISVSAFALTGGFEELFDEPDPMPENGWEVSADCSYYIEGGEFLMESAENFQARRSWSASCIEFAANLRVLDGGDTAGEFGLLLENGASYTVQLTVDANNSSLRINNQTIRQADDPDLEKYHQLRIIKTGGRALCYFDDVLVDDVPSADPVTHCSVFG